MPPKTDYPFLFYHYHPMFVEWEFSGKWRSPADSSCVLGSLRSLDTLNQNIEMKTIAPAADMKMMPLPHRSAIIPPKREPRGMATALMDATTENTLPIRCGGKMDWMAAPVMTFVAPMGSQARPNNIAPIMEIPERPDTIQLAPPRKYNVMVNRPSGNLERTGANSAPDRRPSEMAPRYHPNQDAPADSPVYTGRMAYVAPMAPFAITDATKKMAIYERKTIIIPSANSPLYRIVDSFNVLFLVLFFSGKRRELYTRAAAKNTAESIIKRVTAPINGRRIPVRALKIMSAPW